VRRAVRFLQRARVDVRSDWESQVRDYLDSKPLARRTVLAAPLLALVGGLVAVRSYAPRPDPATGWLPGRRLATAEGRHLRPDDIPVGGAVPVWPSGMPDSERGGAMLIHLRQPPAGAGQAAHAASESLVAYSRICTHAGCPVTLFREDDQSLFCPCHQATFDAAAGAEPTFGPAPRPLPRLPLGIDESGYVVALGDFDATPGATRVDP
jgi:ubiquinol-cytochrome c reductase iron-sulfur subunit